MAIDVVVDIVRLSVGVVVGSGRVSKEFEGDAL